MAPWIVMLNAILGTMNVGLWMNGEGVQYAFIGLGCLMIAIAGFHTGQSR